MTYRQLTIPSEKNLRVLMLADRRILRRRQRANARGISPDTCESDPTPRVARKRRALPRVGHTAETKAKIAAGAKAVWQSRQSHQPGEAVSCVLENGR
jgi:hypothetical protein